MTQNLIYGLIDPRTRLVRYIGLSSTGMHRPAFHKSLAPHEQTYKANWIKSLHALVLDYEIVVLEEEPADLAQAERWWIAFGRACGWPLTNLTSGGDGSFGYKHEEATLAKMRGRKLTDAQRAAVSARQRGRKRGPLPPEVKAKISEANKGRDLGPEWRQKISNTLKGRRVPPEALAKRFGRKQTPEQIAARVASRKRTMEARKNRYVALPGMIQASGAL